MQSSHGLYRAKLRDQLIEVIKKTNLVEDSKIFPNFTIRIPQDRLPCFFISAPADKAEAMTFGTPVFMRTATLVIQYFCSYANIEDATKQVDDVCYQLENALMCDFEFQQMIELIPSFDTEVIFHADTAKKIAEIRFVMTCKYREEFYPEAENLQRISGQTI